MSSLVIVVSGGSRGLGQGIVRRLLEVGHCVATFSRKASAFIDELSGHAELSERFFYETVDARRADSLRDFVQRANNKFGRIDALVNNAGVAHEGVLPLAGQQQIDQMLDVNLKAALVLTKECSRLMLDQESGSIINISSVVGQRGFAGLAVYSATKAALDGMTRALARELGPRNIRVNTIAPGYLETEMSGSLTDSQRQRIIRRTPLGRLGSVDDIVPWIEFLLSPDSRFLTGQVITVDGGATV